MRIISKFRDFYDGVQALGFDERCVFLRKTEETKITGSHKEILNSYFRLMHGKLSHVNIYNRAIIGFCGKLYPVYQIEFKPDVRDYIGRNYIGRDIEFMVKDSVYSAKQINHFLGSHKLTRGGVPVFNSRPPKHKYYSDNWIRKSDVDKLVEIRQSNKLNSLFVDHKVPCFVIKETERGKYTLTVNPCLKDYKFYKIEDSFGAYQKINQYISGILGLNDPDIVHISDENMKAQKGFDDMSFKKLPTKRR